MSNPFASWSVADVAAYNARSGKSMTLEDAERMVNAVRDEVDLHNQIIDECKKRGWIYFHGSMAHQAMRTVGEPDFTILADGGRVFFFECKNKIGKLSSEQLGLQIWAQRLGHTIHTVRSVDQFIEVIGKHRPGEPNKRTDSK